MDLENLVRQATLAPSGHNTQPWRFSIEGRVIRIHPDFTRRLPVVDPDDHALYISLGCALENLVVAAEQAGHETAVEYLPDFLQVALTPSGGARASTLFDAIPVRQSNRSRYNGMKVRTEDLDKLLECDVYDGVELKVWRTDQPDIEPIIEFVKAGNRFQFEDEAFVNELITWIRFSEQEVRSRRDGLSARALGFPPVPRWLGNMIMKTFAKPEREAKKCEKAIRSSSLLLLFVAARNDQQHWVDVGRTFERVVLTAASLGIAHAHMNMPCEVVPVRKKLADHLGLDNGEQPLLLIRLGYAKPLPQALRRPVEEVLQRG